MPEYSGSCHCGDVVFQIDAEIGELTTCDCSLCRKKNAVMTKVHKSDFKMLSSWNTVSEYRWNTEVARHYHCRRCGIYTFHRKRAQPDHYGINIFCLDDFDPTSVETVPTEGASMSVTAADPLDTWPGPRKPG